MNIGTLPPGMGRCYEFGVAVHEGCEAAMAVVAEGGACACAACGATCGGRFSACADVTATPGYVPVEIAAPRATTAAPAVGSVAPAEAIGAATLDPAEALVAMRDLTDAFDRLGRELDAQSESRDEILETLRDLAERVSRLEQTASDRWPRLRPFRSAGDR